MNTANGLESVIGEYFSTPLMKSILSVLRRLKNAMSTHTEYQKIEYKGKPAYVLIPWEDWNRIKPLLDAQKAVDSGIPQEVVEAHVLRNDSLIKAWREYLGITQKELADRLGISQAAVAKFESPEARLRRATLRKICAALELNENQLVV